MTLASNLRVTGIYSSGATFEKVAKNATTGEDDISKKKFLAMRKKFAAFFRLKKVEKF